jgi:metal-sulfur cluster biosynthetic enzyme
MILQQLKTVRDPEIPVDIVNLGLVYAAASSPLDSGGRRIDVRMSLTAPGCSMSDVIKAEVEQKLAALPDVREVRVEIVFDPPWNPAMMSEGAKLHLGFDSGYGVADAKSGPSNSGSSPSGPFKVLR